MVLGDEEMKRTFAYTKNFDEKWGKLGLTDDDLLLLEMYLSKNPTTGKVIRGTGGLRKLRWAIPDSNKGKSGGARVLYIDFINYEKLFLIDIYGKNEKEDITEQERQAFQKLINTIAENLRKGL